MNLTPIEIKTVLDALYDAEIAARQNAREHAAHGTDAGKQRAKEWSEAARVYRYTLEALHAKR